MYVRAYTRVSIQLMLEEVEHDDRTGSLFDAVSLSVNDRVDCNFKHHSIRCKIKVEKETIRMY